MNPIAFIIAVLIFISCSDTPNGNQSKHTERYDTISNDVITIAKESVDKSAEYKENDEFNIKRFRLQCDSLLKSMKGEQYSFKIQSDTFDCLTDNAEEFTYGHGLFWRLYQDTSKRVIRHYLFAPNTKKKIRIYLIEAYYNQRKDLSEKIKNLEIAMNDTMPRCNHCNNYVKMRLSPLHDYVMTGERKLYWLNAGYPYSNSEFLQFVNCLKANVDNTKYKGEIICLFGSDCKNKNVP